jgi:hypothetical protein
VNQSDSKGLAWNPESVMHLKAPAAAARAHEELLAYWTSLKVGQSLPGRADLNPEQIKRHLPLVSLIDVMAGGYRLRLAGTGLFSVYGGEITGRSLAEVYAPDLLAYWKLELHKIVQDAKPAMGLHDLSWLGRPELSLLWLRLPLSSNGKDVDMILGYDAVVNRAAQGLSGNGDAQILSSGIRAA